MNLNYDIICVTESHLVKNKNIGVKNYIWIGHNRLNISATAIKGSGGEGISNKNNWYDLYHVQTTDSSIDGITVCSLLIS